MQVTAALNSMLGSALVVLLIFANYNRKNDVDSFQRRNFLLLLLFISVSMVCDFLFSLLNGSPQPWAYYVLAVSRSIYFAFQIASFYYILVFIDYTTGKNAARTKKLLRVVWVIIAAHGLLLAANFFTGFYFTVSRPDNVYHDGRFFVIRVAVSYLAAALGLLGAILPGIQQEKRFNWHKFILVLVFSLFLGIPGAFDLAFGTNSLVWVGLSAALLYTYCYIISLDLHSDALTGIGNRFAFDEFIEKLSRKKKKEEWGLIMLDMDRLKEINDTLGHLSGDRALCDMAGIITSCINFDDFAARYGGDEFIIVTQGCPKTLMARIQQGITDFNETQGRSYKIQMSYGFDTFTTGSHTLMQDLVCHVDSLMYKQKKYKTERRRIVEAFGVEAEE